MARPGTGAAYGVAEYSTPVHESVPIGMEAFINAQGNRRAFQLDRRRGGGPQ